MENLELKTVREIALEMPLSTRVFEEFRIDYCCGGRKPFVEACDIAGVKPETVAARITESIAFNGAPTTENFNELPLGLLVDHILEKHHLFTRSEIEQLTPLMEKVATRHGPRHSSLYILKSYVLTLFGDLVSHMAKEEAILFPYLRELLGREGTVTAASPAFGSVRSPVDVMMGEHDRAGELLKKIRAVASDYTLPEGACPSFTALFSRLEALEKDLHQHIHLENNILFPKAIELERRIYPLAVG